MIVPGFLAAALRSLQPVRHGGSARRSNRLPVLRFLPGSR